MTLLRLQPLADMLPALLQFHPLQALQVPQPSTRLHLHFTLLDAAAPWEAQLTL
jgi:hypothetical protein